MAFCANCGKQISDGATACPECGHPTGRTGPYAVAGARTESLAVVSLILGIAGFLVCPLITSILAVIFGNQARNKIRDDPSLEGDGLARAGIILGWIGIAFAAVGLVLVVLALAFSTSTGTHIGNYVPIPSP